MLSIKRILVLLFLYLSIVFETYSSENIKDEDYPQYNTEVEINLPLLDVSFKLPPMIRFDVSSFLINSSKVDNQIYYNYDSDYLDRDIDFYFMRPNNIDVSSNLTIKHAADIVDEDGVEIRYIKDKKDIENIGVDENDDDEIKYMTDEDFKNYMIDAIKKETESPFAKPIKSINTDFGEFIGYRVTYEGERYDYDNDRYEIDDIVFYMCFRDGYRYLFNIRKDIPTQEYKKQEFILKSIRKKDLSKEREAYADSIKQERQRVLKINTLIYALIH